MKFRKRPVVIEAWQFTAPQLPCPDWLSEAYHNGTAWYQGGDAPYISIQTLEGVMCAAVGDWIIRGIKGELYPCKPDIFEATYEAAE